MQLPDYVALCSWNGRVIASSENKLQQELHRSLTDATKASRTAQIYITVFDNCSPRSLFTARFVGCFDDLRSFPRLVGVRANWWIMFLHFPHVLRISPCGYSPRSVYLIMVLIGGIERIIHTRGVLAADNGAKGTPATGHYGCLEPHGSPSPGSTGCTGFI